MKRSFQVESRLIVVTYVVINENKIILRMAFLNNIMNKNESSIRPLWLFNTN